MKYINSFQINKSTITSAVNQVVVNVRGDIDSVFSLQIKDSSTPNKFFNFKTNAFTNTFTSENTLSNIKLRSRVFSKSITIPAVTNANTYRFFLFTDSHFNTQVKNSENKYLLTQDLSQEGGVTVRFTLATDQAAARFEGIGSFAAGGASAFSAGDASSIEGSSNTANNSGFFFAQVMADSDSEPTGYKCSFDKTKGGNFIADSLQPADSDFFIKFTKVTNGTGSSATEMILDDVNNLVVGMSLVDIASSSVTTSGSLGVLTYPTITAINTATNTVTLSSAHSWGNDANVIFRAYGSELIRKSVGLTFEQFLTVTPTNGTGLIDGGLSTDFITITSATNTSMTASVLTGVSAGSRVVGPGIDSTETSTAGQFNNDITGITVGPPRILTMRANQNVIADNTKVSIAGSTQFMKTSGDIVITNFPSIDVDFFYDLDRSHILVTTS